jgi:hypothetical protein
MSKPICIPKRALSWIEKQAAYEDELKAARNNTESKCWYMISQDYPIGEPCFICISCEFRAIISESRLPGVTESIVIACCPMTDTCEAAAVFYGKGNPVPLRVLREHQAKNSMQF